ncbi:hypothetical protein [Mycolicibacterium grossiae]|uniref:hypothetical protein n=1 Tax=Mycolicibacterium grossiae TaxID=1552759 RepID=UPI000F772B0C|nr:hypothetical protein [Mycolicibacterium grossiae]QEM43667.1 hypothetical protein FZ046_01760 [Mycolicibacterium grossiae]
MTKMELSSGGVAHFVPIAQPLRGALIDTLEVEASDGVQNSILGRIDTLTVIRVIMARAIEKVGLDPTDPEVEPYLEVAQMKSEDSSNLFNALRRFRRDDVKAAPGYEKSVRLARDRTFFALFSFFRLHQLLLVPCTSERVFFKVTYRTSIGQSRYRGHGAFERTRRALGLAPYNYRIEIPLALAAQSYHLRMRGPARHYVRSFTVLATFLGVTQSPHSMKDWELRQFKPAGGVARCDYRVKDMDNLAHLYTQNLSTARNRPRRLAASVVFDETPLGQLAGALVRLLAVLLAITAASFMVEGLIGTQASLVPALLVALPGALGMSSLINAGAGELAAPISARLGAILAAVASIVATLAIVSWISSRGGCSGTPGCNTSIPGDIRMILLATEWLIGVAAAWCFIALIANIKRYMATTEGPQFGY